MFVCVFVVKKMVKKDKTASRGDYTAPTRGRGGRLPAGCGRAESSVLSPPPIRETFAYLNKWGDTVGIDFFCENRNSSISRFCLFFLHRPYLWGIAL